MSAHGGKQSSEEESEFFAIPMQEESDGADSPAPSEALDENGYKYDLGRPVRPNLIRLLARSGDGLPHRLLSMTPPGQERTDIRGRVVPGQFTNWWGASFECSDGKVRGACFFNLSDVNDSWLRELAASGKARLVHAVENPPCE